MSYFLGFVPDKEANYQIKRVVAHISTLFNDFDIPVRWVKPNTFHLTLFYLGDNLFFPKQILLKKKISKIPFKKFKVSFNTVKVGISRTYQDLVYLDLSQRGEELREYYSQVRKVLGEKDSSLFVPHLTIGRISKDLTKEEYRNVSSDVTRVSKKLKLDDIQFTVDGMYLIHSKDGVYTFKMKFDAL